MLENAVFSFLVATALGFLSGLGVGGGSLLVLWATLILDMSPDSARLLNLLFFLPSAVIASVFHRKQGRLDLKKILPAIIGGCIAAGLCSAFSRLIETHMLKRLFGILLIITGLRELFTKSSAQRRKAR